MKTTSTLLLLAIASPVLAVTINTGGTAVANQGLFTLVSQTMTVNFNTGMLPNGSLVQYEGAATNVVTGNISGVTAAPPNDTSAYLTIGPTRGNTVTIRFSRMMDYFGFYVGSLDTYNFIDFYQGSSKVLGLSGTEIAKIGNFPANGDQSRGIYVNIFASNASEEFNRIVLSSTSNALESDNHAFRAVDRTVSVVESPVPEPTTFLLLGSALLALGLSRRHGRYGHIKRS